VNMVPHEAGSCERSRPLWPPQPLPPAAPMAPKPSPFSLPTPGTTHCSADVRIPVWEKRKGKLRTCPEPTLAACASCLCSTISYTSSSASRRPSRHCQLRGAADPPTEPPIQEGGAPEPSIPEGGAPEPSMPEREAPEPAIQAGAGASVPAGDAASGSGNPRGCCAASLLCEGDGAGWS
jgi:hypothetical protein